MYMDYNTILRACKASRLSYFNELQKNPIYRHEPLFFDRLTDVQFFSDPVTDAQCVCMRDPENNTVYVAFRGTSSRRDILVDLWIQKAPFPFFTPEDQKKYKDVKIHRGFLCQYLSLRDEILTYILRFQSSVKKVVFTGHSLGGALSSIASLDATFTVPAIQVAHVSFGSPRVGNRPWSKLYNIRVNGLRVIHDDDPVTRIPTSLRWSHCGNVLLIRGHKVTMNPLRFNGWAARCSQLSDHKLSEYLTDVERLREKITSVLYGEHSI